MEQNASWFRDDGALLLNIKYLTTGTLPPTAITLDPYFGKYATF